MPILLVFPAAMSKFVRSDFNLKNLADNSFKAVEEGAYNADGYNFSHESINLRKQILACPHAPLITEIKLASPSKGTIRTKDKPKDIALLMSSAGATGLSVLTQPYLFNGSIDYLAQIRKVVSLPLLMKDIVVSEVQIDAAKRIGADCILLIQTIFDKGYAEGSIDRFVEYSQRKGLQVLLEVHTQVEFNYVARMGHNLIGINNRNLDNLKIDKSTTGRLLKDFVKPKGTIVISESGIDKPEDIRELKKAGADAFLVGTSIMESNDVEAKVKELYYSI